MCLGERGSGSETEGARDQGTRHAEQDEEDLRVGGINRCLAERLVRIVGHDHVAGGHSFEHPAQPGRPGRRRGRICGIRPVIDGQCFVTAGGRSDNP
jgi:hypothetical protein